MQILATFCLDFTLLTLLKIVFGFLMTAIYQLLEKSNFCKFEFCLAFEDIYIILHESVICFDKTQNSWQSFL